MRSWLIVTAALILFSPLAAASPVTGTLVASALQLPGDSEVNGHALAFLLNATSGGSSPATIHADRLHIAFLTKQHVAAGALFVDPNPVDPTREDHDFTNATLTIAVGRSTIIGGYPTTDSHANFTATSTTEAHPERKSYVSEGAVDAESSPQGLPWYRVDVDRPHLLVSEPGTADLDGTWILKVRNARVSIDAREGHIEFDTTEQRPSAVQQTIRWLVMQSDALDATISSATDPITVAFASGSAGWRGAAVVSQASGALSSAGEEYRADHAELVTLDGDLRVAFAPGSTGDHAVATFFVTGDLKSTSLAASTTTTAPAPAVPVWILGALAVGLAASGSGVLLLVRRPKHAAESTPVAEPEPTPPLILVPPDAEIRRMIETDGIEAVTDLMEEAGGNEQWHDALRVARIVQDVAPTSLRLALNIAIFLEFTGDVEGALRAYEHASSLSPDDGHIEYDASVTARSNGLPPEVTEEWILRALQKTPELWPEVRALPPELSHRPAIRRAIRAARERCLDDDF